VGYLNDSLRGTMQKVTGRPGDTPDQLDAELKKVEGAGTNNLLGVIGAREASIKDLTSKLEQADKARQTALADLQAEAARVQQKIAAYDKTVATLNGDIDRYKSEVEQYRQQVNEAKLAMSAHEDKNREGFNSQQGALNDRIRKLEAENLQLSERLAGLQKEKTRDILKGKPEESLVDGTIIGANPGNGEVTISRGLKDKVVLGMTFAVYGDGTAIKPGPDGMYPLGKAAIEVINIGDSTSTCRIIRETRGNPVVKGDVVANAIYDPNKVYTFLVYGNFDCNGDGAATPAEASDIRAMIEGWGGRTTDELAGSVDFLVLGQRPIVPPPPKAGDPTPLVQEYMRIDQMATRYDELTRQAGATSVPILNENRLYTLIGRRPGVR